MISQYQNELFALIAIVILLLVYLLIKRKMKTETAVQTQPKVEEQTVTEPKVQTQVDTEKELKTEHAVDTVATSHQKDTKEEQVKTTPKVEKNRVPSHGKITKEDFKIFAGERILLAEDNLINQKVILGVLADSGIEVVVANDGQEALDILQTDKDFIIILMDAHMPRVDGFEATKAIRQNPAYNHITVVALSGDTAADDIKKMKDAGMDEHLEKPLRVDAFYDILYQYSKKVIPQAVDQQPQEEVTSSDLTTLNTQRGLEICGNDVGFYQDILQEFLNTYSNSTQELEVLLKNNKKDQANKLLLDIVGVSANIGADALTECANKIKSDITANKKISLNTFSSRVQDLLQSIHSYLSKRNA